MKTQINYSVTQNGQHYNGTVFARPNLSEQSVARAAIRDAAKKGFHCVPITVTATGCETPWLARTVLP